MLVLLFAVAWALLVLGFTYLAGKASIFRVPRDYMVLKFKPWMASLLGCPWCTSFWTGMIAAAILLPVSPFPWWTWFYLPACGVAGIGLQEIVYRISPMYTAEYVLREMTNRQEGGSGGTAH